MRHHAAVAIAVLMCAALLSARDLRNSLRPGFYGFGFTGQGIDLVSGQLTCLVESKAQPLQWYISRSNHYSGTFAIDPVYIYDPVSGNPQASPIFNTGVDERVTILEADWYRTDVPGDWLYILYTRPSAIVEDGIETGCWTCVELEYDDPSTVTYRTSSVFWRCNVKQIEGVDFTSDDCQVPNPDLITDGPIGSNGPTTDLCPEGIIASGYVLAEAEIYSLQIPNPLPHSDGPVGNDPLAQLPSGMYGFLYPGQAFNTNDDKVECPAVKIPPFSVNFWVNSDDYSGTITMDPPYTFTSSGDTFYSIPFTSDSSQFDAGRVVDTAVDGDWYQYLYHTDSAAFPGATAYGCLTCVVLEYNDPIPFTHISPTYRRCNGIQDESRHLTYADCLAPNANLISDRPVGEDGPLSNLCPTGYVPSANLSIVEYELYNSPIPTSSSSILAVCASVVIAALVAVLF